jgi:hypothetical protein
MFIITVGCSGKFDKKNVDDMNVLHINIDSLISQKPIYYSQLFTGYRIIPLETKEECVFNRISNLKILNDTFFVFDANGTKTLFLFSMEGKFINKISKIGRGPGESINPVDFDIDSTEKKLIIGDFTSHKLSFYNTRGIFLKELVLPESFISFVTSKDGVYLFTPFPIRNNKDESLIHQFNRKGEAISKYIKYSETKKGPEILWLQDYGYFFNNGNDIRFFMHYSDTIFTIKNSTIKPFIALETKKYRLTDDDMTLIRNSNEPHKRGIDKLFGVNRYSENKSVALFSFFIGPGEYYAFYNFKRKATLCSSRFVDDITYIYPSLLRIYGNHILATFDPQQLAYLRERIASGKINLPEDLKKTLSKIPYDNNPVLVIYDLKPGYTE